VGRRDAPAIPPLDQTPVASSATVRITTMTKDEPLKSGPADQRRPTLSGSVNWAVVSIEKRQYDLVMLSGVWMHLDTEEREKAMPVVVALMRGGGTMMLSLRHGPANPSRRVFDVPADETLALAERHGLSCVLRQSAPSVGQLNRAAGVTWTHLAFVKNAVHLASS
jgi:hypothetical protein